MTTQRQEEDFKKTEATRSDSHSSTTTSYHTDPGVSAYDLEVIRRHYEGVLRCYLNSVTAGDIEKAIEGGLEASAILDALDETAMAPRPSHFYFRAILKRYMAEGITTKEKAEAQRFRRRHEQEAKRTEQQRAWYSNPALNYQQRTYTDDDSYFIDLDKYGGDQA